MLPDLLGPTSTIRIQSTSTVLERVVLKLLVLQIMLLSILVLVPELILDLVLDPNMKPQTIVPILKK